MTETSMLAVSEAQNLLQYLRMVEKDLKRDGYYSTADDISDCVMTIKQLIKAVKEK